MMKKTLPFMLLCTLAYISPLFSSTIKDVGDRLKTIGEEFFRSHNCEPFDPRVEITDNSFYIHYVSRPSDGPEKTVFYCKSSKSIPHHFSLTVCHPDVAREVSAFIGFSKYLKKISLNLTAPTYDEKNEKLILSTLIALAPKIGARRIEATDNYNSYTLQASKLGQLGPDDQVLTKQKRITGWQAAGFKADAKGNFALAIEA